MEAENSNISRAEEFKLQANEAFKGNCKLYLFTPYLLSMYAVRVSISNEYDTML